MISNESFFRWLWRLAAMGTLSGVCLILFAWVYLELGEEHSFYCHSVRLLDVGDNAVYFWMTDVESNSRYFVSENGGSAWQQTRDIPEMTLLNRLHPPSIFQPSIVCNPLDPLECYRASGYPIPHEPVLEKSNDGGITWDQHPFPFRIRRPKGCPNSHVTDFTFLQISPETTRLFVGLGTGGLAVRTEDGKWEYRRVSEILFPR